MLVCIWYLFKISKSSPMKMYFIKRNLKSDASSSKIFSFFLLFKLERKMEIFLVKDLLVTNPLVSVSLIFYSYYLHNNKIRILEVSDLLSPFFEMYFRILISAFWIILDTESVFDHWSIDKIEFINFRNPYTHISSGSPS